MRVTIRLNLPMDCSNERFSPIYHTEELIQKNILNAGELNSNACQETYDKLHKQRLSYRGKILRSLRPATVELSFAHSKELHGLRYARYRGVQKVMTQVLMTAIIQNLKKWAKLRSLQKYGLHLTYKIIEESI